MRTVGLTWQHSWELSAVLAVVGAAMWSSSSRFVRGLGAWAREAAVIGALYGLWQVLNKIRIAGPAAAPEAFDRARWIRRFEHDVRLPSEASVQHLVLPHHHVVQAANLYYATMHLTMMFVFLIWLFLRHREDYRRVRMVMAWTTLGCLLVQLVPVAPPRMLPGIVDTATTYGQSVYANGLAIDQLSAMPSIHVAWAVLVGYYVWQVSPSRWRFVGPLHSVLTILVVVSTGNHWWLDGIVGVAILVMAAWSVYGVRTAWRRLRPARVPDARHSADPALAGTAG